MERLGGASDFMGQAPYQNYGVWTVVVWAKGVGIWEKDYGLSDVSKYRPVLWGVGVIRKLFFCVVWTTSRGDAFYSVERR